MDILTVRIPASPSYVRVVRLVAAGLAARLKFTIDDIEDLKMAVDELTSYLTGPRGRPGNLEIDFLMHQDHIEIKGRGHFPDGSKRPTELTELSHKILETVVDSASLERDDGSLVFRLSKRPAPAMEAGAR